MSAAGAGGEGGEGGDPLPRMDFSTFILSLSHTALIDLGDAPAPGGEQAAPNLALARQMLEVIGLLEEKTRGNLTGEEERLLARVLSDLRYRVDEVAGDR